MLFALLLGVGCGELGTEGNSPDQGYATGKADGTARLSAIRRPGESLADAVARQGDALIPRPAGSAMDDTTPLAEVDFANVPEWTMEELTEDFTYLRDTRLLKGSAFSGELTTRRVSWLYPDDGCWLRAEEMNNHLLAHASQRTNKIFIYGELTVETANNPLGSVSWWFHVAPVARVGDVVYVLDPAIEPAQPLPIADWVGRQSDVDAAELRLCSSFTFDPGSECDDAEPVPPTETDQAIQNYLRYEWNRQISLGRDPMEVLGDHPPWQI